jgi:hypothetical protein
MNSEAAKSSGLPKLRPGVVYLVSISWMNIVPMIFVFVSHVATNLTPVQESHIFYQKQPSFTTTTIESALFSGFLTS